jgi:hypothetical protein
MSISLATPKGVKAKYYGVLVNSCRNYFFYVDIFTDFFAKSLILQTPWIHLIILGGFNSALRWFYLIMYCKLPHHSSVLRLRTVPIVATIAGFSGRRSYFRYLRYGYYLSGVYLINKSNLSFRQEQSTCDKHQKLWSFFLKLTKWFRQT